MFTFVDEARFETGLYPLTLDLLSKFNPQIGEVDPEIRDEIEAFLDALLDTEVMQLVQQYLAEWGQCATVKSPVFVHRPLVKPQRKNV